jgi:hypothetical protein
VNPERRTTVFIHCGLIPSQLKASQRGTVLPGEVYGQSFADHQRRPVGGNAGQPNRIGTLLSRRPTLVRWPAWPVS